MLKFISEKLNASFMPINCLCEFYLNTKSIERLCFLGDKRSIENKLNKI